MAWLGLCAIGAIYSHNYPKEFLTCNERPDGPVVQLRACSIPYIRVVAVHCFFVAYDPVDKAWHRYEVWQTADAGKNSWGHVTCDLMPPDSDTGGGPVATYAEWHGQEANQLLKVLRQSVDFPDRNTYHYWPGPNSNTYPAWVLRSAGVAGELPPKAIGKDYLGIVGAGLTTTHTGVQVETPVVGLKVGWRDGMEVHLLCFTFGIDLWHPAVKTPLGRLGVDAG